jgi:glycosyltransferase involved in cell wall biosynthesis
VTIYDLGFLKFPETVTAAHMKRFMWFTKDAVNRAARIIAISECTKNDLCDLLNVSPKKVDVVYLGVDREFYNEAIHPPLRRMKYILTVGTLQPRKNYTMLFRAFRHLCERWSEPIELAIVGKRGWLWEDIERQAADGPYADRIRFLGYVPEREMPGLYAGAEMLVFPSLYEGFGIPALEAMACGTPVVASNASSLPEVVKDAGMLVDPVDDNAWTTAMLNLLGDRGIRTQLRSKGISRSRLFSWERTARETLEIYKSLAGEASRPGRKQPAASA